MIQVRAEAISKQVKMPAVLTILERVTLSINPGDSLAILGPSGSGKTTLLGLLAGLDNPSEGAIFWNDTNICTLSEEARANLRLGQVGFVFQNFQLLPHLTALENVEIGLDLCGKTNESAAKEMLLKVGLIDRCQHYPRQLSGGEQQRVALARAYVVEPKLLFADEPTGNLDWKTAEKIVELLIELNQNQGTTLVVATHSKLLSDQCHHVFSLQEGHLAK
jgi:putative ABC transport system ATP-binding protein